MWIKHRTQTEDQSHIHTSTHTETHTHTHRGMTHTRLIIQQRQFELYALYKSVPRAKLTHPNLANGTLSWMSRDKDKIRIVDFACQPQRQLTFEGVDLWPVVLACLVHWTSIVHLLSDSKFHCVLPIPNLKQSVSLFLMIGIISQQMSLNLHNPLLPLIITIYGPPPTPLTPSPHLFTPCNETISPLPLPQSNS